MGTQTKSEETADESPTDFREQQRQAYIDEYKEEFKHIRNIFDEQ